MLTELQDSQGILAGIPMEGNRTTHALAIWPFAPVLLEVWD